MSSPSRGSWRLQRWLAIAACVVVLLGSGAYIGRGVISNIWTSSGKVTEIRVRDGERIEIVGTEDTPLPPANQAAPIHYEWIIDDDDPGYTENGNWQRGKVAGGYANDYRCSEPGAMDARWTFAVPPGDYEVFATWPSDPNLAASLMYTIHDGEELKATPVVDQRATPMEPAADFTTWQRLGVVAIASGELSVRVDARTTQVDLSQIGNAVCADAMRVRRLAD